MPIPKDEIKKLITDSIPDASIEIKDLIYNEETKKYKFEKKVKSKTKSKTTSKSNIDRHFKK